MEQFKLEGVKEIQKALNDLEKKVASKITRQALRKGNKIVAAAVKEDSPVDTGALKKQTKVKSGKRSRSKISSEVVTTSPNNWYGNFNEYGTSKMPAKHYQKKALDRVWQQAVDLMLKELLAGINAALPK